MPNADSPDSAARLLWSLLPERARHCVALLHALARLPEVLHGVIRDVEDLKDCVSDLKKKLD